MHTRLSRLMKKKGSRVDRGAKVALAGTLITGTIAAAGAGALGVSNPLNDLFALGQGTGDAPKRAPVARRHEPPFVAAPVARCRRGSHPQPGVDGRVPEGSAKNGLRCNVTRIGHQGTEGGFKVFRYTDVRVTCARSTTPH